MSDFSPSNVEHSPTGAGIPGPQHRASVRDEPDPVVTLKLSMSTVDAALAALEVRAAYEYVSDKDRVTYLTAYREMADAYRLA